MKLTLNSILKTPRKHGTQGEKDLLYTLCHTFGMQNLGGKCLYRDNGHGPLFVAHLDTIELGHKSTQNHKTLYRFDDLIVTDGNSTLGADDGAGVYILIEMLTNNVPGGYLFTTGEEVGGIGSTYAEKYHRYILEKYTHAIQFDRRGTSDVIYSMAVGQTGSKQTAQDICNLLNMGHTPSNKGSFTDVANFVDAIPECFNISCGYNNEHSVNESLDIIYLEKLINRLLQVDFSSLRVNKKEDQKDLYNIFRSYRGDDLYSYVFDNPEKVADYLQLMSVTIDDIELSEVNKQWEIS